ncbi:hypothetical protein [Allokutzneria albata]|uniref:hypothetical protein n=1 Tax=Allokutzneria albata TaxID=211114 RepID=UPI0009DF1116|nr:hypothetical protein [Allokutzneria albata]
MPDDRLDDAGSMFSRVSDEFSEHQGAPVRDFGGYAGSFAAEPDLAERTEEALRKRFRGEHGAA